VGLAETEHTGIVRTTASSTLLAQRRAADNCSFGLPYSDGGRPGWLRGICRKSARIIIRSGRASFVIGNDRRRRPTHAARQFSRAQFTPTDPTRPDPTRQNCSLSRRVVASALLLTEDWKTEHRFSRVCIAAVDQVGR